MNCIQHPKDTFHSAPPHQRQVTFCWAFFQSDTHIFTNYVMSLNIENDKLQITASNMLIHLKKEHIHYLTNLTCMLRIITLCKR